MRPSSLAAISWVQTAAVLVAALAIAGCFALMRRWIAAESERREARRLLTFLGDEARDHALWVLAPEGRIREWGRAAERIHGFRAAQIVGRHCSILYREQDRSANLPQQALELAARQGSYRFEGVRLHQQGRELAVESVLHALRDASGRLLGFCEIEHDVSERRRLERLLREAQEALLQSHRLEAIGRLSGGVAHDFNNVIQVVKNCVRVLRRRLEDQPPLLGFLDMIDRNADRAASLSQHLLGFARLEPLAPQPTNVHEVIAAAVQMLRHALGESIVLEQLLASAEPWTRIDRNQLEAVLLSLAADARDTMPSGGRLKIETADAAPPRSAELPDDVSTYLMVRLSNSALGGGRAARGSSDAPDAPDVPDATERTRAQTRRLIEQAGGRLSVEQSEDGRIVTLWLPQMHHTVHTAH